MSEQIGMFGSHTQQTVTTATTTKTHHDVPHMKCRFDVNFPFLLKHVQFALQQSKK